MKSLRLWRIAVAVIVAITVVSIAGAVTRGAVSLAFSPGEQDYRYAVDTPMLGKDLTVSTRFAGVMISRSPDSALHLRASGQYRGGAPVVTVSEDGSRISADCEFRRYGACSVDLAIQIPDGLALTVAGQSSDVAVSGLDVQASITTLSGSVSTRELLGTMEIRTLSGDVTVDASSARSIDVQSTSGRVTLDARTAANSVTVRNAQGDTVIDVPSTDFYDVVASSNYGDVLVDVIDDPNSTNSVSVDSEEGNISIRPR